MAGMVLGISNNIFCRFNRIPTHFLRTRISQPYRLLYNSPVVNSHIKELSKLIDQGKRSILKLKSRDDVPGDFELIYKASMELTMRLGYSTLVVVNLSLLAILVYRHYNKENLVMSTSFGKDKVKFLYPEMELWLFSLGLVSLALAGSALMLKYPLRVYKHCTRKEYIGIYLSPAFPMLRHVPFTSANPAKFKNPLYSVLYDCHYVLDNKKKTFFISHFFRVPKDLTDMYDKPKHLRN